MPTRLISTALLVIGLVLPARAASADNSHLALKKAILHHDLAMARQLLEAGADVDEIDPDSSFPTTPLMLAARENDPAMVRLLLNYGADPKLGQPLAWALSQPGSEYEVVVALLLDGGADVDNEAVPEAARHGLNEVVGLLLEAGASPTQPDGFKRTPLHAAAEGGHLLIALILLDRGADVEARDGQERTPLHGAAGSGDVALVRALLDRGARIWVESKDEYAQTPLGAAVWHGHRSIVKLLLDCGAEPTLAALAAEGDPKRIQPMLAPEQFVSDALNRTPLHAAALHNQAAATRLLIAHGHPASPADRHGDTPLHLAARSGDLATVRALVDGGADPSARMERSLFAENDFTPLHVAIGAGHVEIVRLLIEAGSDLDTVTSSAPSPRQMMEQSENPHLRALVSRLPER